jgi:hypothetical protein
MNGTTIYDFHGRLLRDTFGRDISDQDAFLLFTLFHLYQIELASPVLTDRPQLAEGDRVAALTQRHCSQALASVWAGSREQRADYTYWYWRWNGEWGSYAHAESLTEEERTRLRDLTAKLEEHPFVRRFVPEN